MTFHEADSLVALPAGTRLALQIKPPYLDALSKSQPASLSVPSCVFLFLEDVGFGGTLTLFAHLCALLIDDPV